MYLPMYQRVNRISGSSRKGRFIGSDFTYEDLHLGQVADGEHTLVEETGETWVVDTVLADSAQYSRLRSHITKGDHVTRRIAFFDKDGDPTKRLEVLQTTTIDGGVYPVWIEMVDLGRGTYTTLEVTDRRIDVPLDELPPETFTAAHLEG